MIGRLAPLFGFLLLALLLAAGLMIADKKTELPSTLIGKEMPDFNLPILGQADSQMSRDDLVIHFAGQPFLLNVWASWCPPCRLEHPVITELARSGRIPIVGYNYRDTAADANDFLTQFGDPFVFHLADVTGRSSIDFGVVAAPETFLIDPNGLVRFKHIGVLTFDVIEQELNPLLEEMGQPR